MAFLARHPKRFAAAMRLAGATKAARLIVVTQGAINPSDVTAGAVVTETTVRCRGLVVSWTRSRFQGTDVQAGDRVVHLIATTLRGSVPKISDRVTIEGVTGRIINLDRDGAAAVWICLVRA